MGNLSYTMDRQDFREIIQSIREGKQLSDFMVVAIHCHVNSFAFQAYSHDNSTPDFLVQLPTPSSTMGQTCSLVTAYTRYAASKSTRAWTAS